MKVGYLGPIGTYCYMACKNYVKENDEIIPFRNIQETINNVITKYVDKCVVPLENSIEGSVSETLGVILDNQDLKIEGEIVIKVNHAIVSKEKVDLKDVKTVYSHPQALAQCRKFILNNMPNAVIEATKSTAEAATKVKELPYTVAISNDITAEIYNLEILKRDVQDEINNQTKFIILSCKEQQQGWNKKVSIVFSTLNKPGELYKILGLFNIFDINLTKIESRPARTTIGEYIFWIDFDTNQNEDNINILLNQIKKRCSHFRILGTYERVINN